jgi:hypothetical protein
MTRNDMTAHIFRPAPNAMQAGRGNSREWVLIFEADSALEIEPLMGYTSSRDTRRQVRLTFETQEEAETFARRNGIPYTVQPPRPSSVKRTVYSDNFRSDRKIPWTH